jgi:hypothetical protein
MPTIKIVGMLRHFRWILLAENLVGGRIQINYITLSESVIHGYILTPTTRTE